ncbi:malto-oligosyltrehalose synthase [soil metagenome]
MIPRATLRLQFHRGFTFADAEALVPYFSKLGVSHLYASPIATARPGSMHGYDAIDATRVNPELGGEAGLRTLSTALRAAGMGLILDIVPNHMAADLANAWWADVLRHGKASRYARYFDIDWQADEKVLLPILGGPLDEVLKKGELKVTGDAIAYFDNRLPLAEGTGDRPDFASQQHYRLAWWRSAGDRINWRRFFDINELVSLRIEEEEVFDAVHALPLRLHEEGIVDGLRVDHVDGLTDPAGYCRTLRQRLKPGAWLVVEKILLGDERLVGDWGCDGTTGYDFMNEVNALQHDAAGAVPLAEAWARLSGRPGDFAPEEEQARREVLARSFGAQLESCAVAFAGGELAAPTLRRVLGELLAHFPVYRTYGTGGRLSPTDRAVLDHATAGARRTCLATDRWAIDPVVALFDDPQHRRAIARFQQLSAPIAAKAVEDTGFYRYGRLLSRNDVGFDAATFALDGDAFHRRMQARADAFPQTMLTTATHDHKRGEDVRARLAVLSGLSAEWAALQQRWVDAAAPLRDKGAPGPGDIAMLLQTVIGAWPLDLAAADSRGRAEFAERLIGWQQKALREAKLASDWAAVDEAYEQAAGRFVTALLVDGAHSEILSGITSLVRHIAPAGALNGLTQALLRLTVPGVPDLYQGTELWDFSLVDPDNRRPVDWPRRIAGLAVEPTAVTLQALAMKWRDGGLKQALIAVLLDLRRRLPRLFAEGDYRPVAVEGPLADAVLAFERRQAGSRLLVVVPRLPQRLSLGEDVITIGRDAWKGTAIRLADVPGQPLLDVVNGRRIEAGTSSVALADLCAPLPMAVCAV